MPSDLSAQLVDARDFLKEEFDCRAIEIFRDPLFDFFSELLLPQKEPRILRAVLRACLMIPRTFLFTD